MEQMGYGEWGTADASETAVFCSHQRLFPFQETPPDGEQFADVVKHVLGREEFWNNWKNEGCPPFDKPKTNATVPIIRKPRKKPVGEDVLEG